MPKQVNEHSTKLMLRKTKIAEKKTLFGISMSQHCHQQQSHRTEPFLQSRLKEYIDSPTFCMFVVLKSHFSIHHPDTHVPQPVADALLFPVPLQPAERLPQGAA